MSLYVIGDLHLSGSVNKPMDRFGSRWTDHTDKLRARWSSLVKEGDTVVLPGDFSWAMDLTEAEADFRFLASLPGKKILSKGNHDFWWTGVSRMKSTLEDWGIDDVDFLHNNAFLLEDKIIVGSRGWFMEEKQQAQVFPADYEKLVSREIMRLEHSISEGKKQQSRGEEILCFLHFPPLWGSFSCQPLLDVLSRHGIRRCYFGHIHGRYNVPRSFSADGITFTLISADFLNFIPQFIAPADTNFQKIP